MPPTYLSWKALMKSCHQPRDREMIPFPESLGPTLFPLHPLSFYCTRILDLQKKWFLGWPLLYEYCHSLMFSSCRTPYLASPHITISHSHSVFTQAKEWSPPQSQGVDCRLYLGLTDTLLLILSGVPGCTWLSQLLSLLQSGSVPQLSLPFMIHLKSAGPLFCLGLMLFFIRRRWWSQKWGTHRTVSYWGPCNKRITGDTNHYHRVKVLSARFVHHEVTIFSFYSE